MRKKFKLIGTAALCLAIAGSIAFDAARPTDAVEQTDVDDAQNEADEVAEKIEELQNELDDIANNITDTQSYIAELDNKLESYSNQLVDIQNQIDAKQVEIDAKKAEISSKQEEIATAETELAAAQAKEVEQYDAMTMRIQYMYECGDETFLDMLFSSEDLSDLLGKAEYINDVVSYDRAQFDKIIETQNQIDAMLEELETEKEALEAEKEALEAEQNEMYALESDLQNEQTYIDTILAEKETKLTELENKKSYTETEIAEAEAEQAEKQAIADSIKKAYEEALAKAAAEGTDTSELAQKTLEAIGLSGGFTWPLPGYSTITSEWGYRDHPILHQWILHDGMDISGGGVYGKPILAAYSGTVSIASTANATSGYGYYVQIDHGVGVSTLYAHMSVVAVSEGQYVDAGQVIGYVGSTGNSTGPHLHFSVFIGGVSQNPRDYITVP